MKISYGITVKDESEELFELLQILKKNIDEEDEIIIVKAIFAPLLSVTQTVHR